MDVIWKQWKPTSHSFQNSFEVRIQPISPPTNPGLQMQTDPPLLPCIVVLQACPHVDYWDFNLHTLVSTSVPGWKDAVLQRFNGIVLFACVICLRSKFHSWVAQYMTFMWLSWSFFWWSEISSEHVCLVEQSSLSNLNDESNTNRYFLSITQCNLLCLISSALSLSYPV